MLFEFVLECSEGAAGGGVCITETDCQQLNGRAGVVRSALGSGRGVELQRGPLSCEYRRRAAPAWEREGIPGETEKATQNRVPALLAAAIGRAMLSIEGQRRSTAVQPPPN